MEMNAKVTKGFARLFAILAVLLLLLSFSVFNALAVIGPAVVYVDDSWLGTPPGDDPDGPGPATNFGYDAFATVQDGVNGVATGGTIYVADGTYYEHDITISQSLTLTGDPGDAQPGPGLSAPVVDGEDTYTDAFLIANGTSNVTIQGFEIRNYATVTPGANGEGNAVQAWVNGTDHITVTDNYMHNLDWNGVLVGNDNGIAGHSYWTVARNILTDFGPPAFATSGYGLEVSDASHVVIEDNDIDAGTGFPGTGILIHFRGTYGEDIVIQRNQIRGAYDFAGINVQASTQYTTPSQLDSVQILNNDVEISGTAYAAVQIRNKLSGTVTNSTVRDNRLIHSGGYGIRNWSVAETINASGNWFGDNTPAGVASEVNGDVDYTPWLDSGTDISTAFGFQGDFSVLDVDDDSPQSGATGEIQEGIDMVTGSTVNVMPGIYREQVVVNKSVTLTGDRGDVAVAGPGLDAPTLDGDLDNNGAPDMGDGFTIPQNTSLSGITIEGFIIRNFGNGGGGNGVGVGVISWENTSSDVTIRDNWFYNLGYNGVYVGTDSDDMQNNWQVQYNIVDGAPYAGIELTDVTNSGVLNNQINAPSAIFDDPGDAGVGIEIAARARDGAVTTSNVLVQGNTISGAFASGSRAGINLLSRAYNLGRTAVLTGITVEYNTISGSGTRGIYAVAESRSGGSSQIDTLTITQNTLDGNTSGIEIGGSFTPPKANGTYDFATFDINGNQLAGNTTYGLNNLIASMVTAEYNWWGDDSGPNHASNPSGTGDAVSDYVDFVPWCGDADCNFRIPGSIGVRANGDMVEGYSWVKDGTVDVLIGADPEFPDAALYDVPVTACDWNPDAGCFSAEFTGGDAYDIVTGNLVTVQQGAAVKDTTVVDLEITNVNADTDVVTGTAGALADVTLWVCPSCTPDQYTTADGDGNWFFDFSPPGDPVIRDIVGNDWVDSAVCEPAPDNDCTVFGVGVPNPWFNASAQNDWVQAHNWEVGTVVDLYVNSTYIDTQTMTVPPPWDPSGTDPGAQFDLTFDLVPTDVVSLTGGGFTKTLTVSNFAVTDVDVTANTLTGVANLSAPDIETCADYSLCIQRLTSADPSGNWSVDYTGDYDIVPGSEGWAAEWDADGDATWYDWRVAMPWVQASAQNDWVGAHEWPVGTVVDLYINSTYIDSKTMTVPPPWDPSGTESGAQFDLWDVTQYDPPINLMNGDVVTITDGTTPKTLSVTWFAVTGINTTADTITGVAIPGAPSIETCADYALCISRTTSADPSGNWSVDYTGADPYDLVPGSQGWAAEWDLDGDATWWDWWVKPGVFNKTSPANGVIDKPINLFLAWSVSEAADYYEYCLDTIDNGVCDTGWVDNGGGTSVYLTGLDYSTTYFWHVRAVNGGGMRYSGSPSGFRNFTTMAPPPGSFNKTSPANGATGRAINLYLMWSASTGADYYEYCLDTINNGACDTGWIANGTATSEYLSGLDYSTTYFWQVRAVNGSGTTYAGAPNGYRSFTTKPAPPGAFNKTSPANGATGRPFNVWIAWSSSVGADSYEYCYDTTVGNTCEGTWTSVGPSTSTWLFSLDPGTTYFWQVRALNTGGTTYAGSPNGYRSFTTHD